MPDEILTAREIMLYIGIPTINYTKDMKQIFYNTALNFSYYNPCDDTDNCSYSLTLLFVGNKIFSESVSITGWDEGAVALCSIRYR